MFFLRAGNGKRVCPCYVSVSEIQRQAEVWEDLTESKKGKASGVHLLEAVGMGELKVN